MPKIDHVHKYRRLGKRNAGRFICADPLCDYKSTRDAIKGKLSRCSMCDREFILDPYALSCSKPACMDCRTTQFAKIKKDLAPQLEELFNSQPDLGGKE